MFLYYVWRDHDIRCSVWTILTRVTYFERISSDLSRIASIVSLIVICVPIFYNRKSIFVLFVHLFLTGPFSNLKHWWVGLCPSMSREAMHHWRCYRGDHGNYLVEEADNIRQKRKHQTLTIALHRRHHKTPPKPYTLTTYQSGPAPTRSSMMVVFWSLILSPPLANTYQG
jgi:hypothetical protein